MPFFPTQKYDCMVKNMDMEKQCTYNFRNTEKPYLGLSMNSKMSRAEISIQTILILIFDKHIRRGADVRCQVLVIGAKI